MEEEAGHDAEVAAATFERPVEVGVFVCTGAHIAAVGQDDVVGQHVVADRPELRVKPADAAAQRQASHAGRRDDAACRRQVEGCRLVVEISPKRATLGISRLGLGIDLDAAHARHVEQHPAVGNGVTSYIVTAAFDRQQQFVLAGEVDGADDVGHASWLNGQRWILVMHTIPERACLVVALITEEEKIASNSRPELFDRLAIDLARDLFRLLNRHRVSLS